MKAKRNVEALQPMKRTAEDCCGEGDCEPDNSAHILGRMAELRSRLRNHVLRLSDIESKLIVVKCAGDCEANPDDNTLDGILSECERIIAGAESLGLSIAEALGQ